MRQWYYNYDNEKYLYNTTEERHKIRLARINNVKRKAGGFERHRIARKFKRYEQVPTEKVHVCVENRFLFENVALVQKKKIWRLKRFDGRFSGTCVGKLLHRRTSRAYRKRETNKLFLTIS